MLILSMAILLTAPLVPPVPSVDIAMAKCSTDAPSAQSEQESSCPKRDRERGSCDSCNPSKKGCSSDQSDASEQLESVRKSAAQKVMEGQ